ncbi:MAG: AMP-binding protein [Symbiopectobacterium sp.]
MAGLTPCHTELTSGSIGLPKAVAHAFSAHIIASAQGVIELMAFTAQDNWLLSLPLFHVSRQGIVWRWLTAGRDWCCVVRNRWSTRCRIVCMLHWGRCSWRLLA